MLSRILDAEARERRKSPDSLVLIPSALIPSALIPSVLIPSVLIPSSYCRH